MPPCPLSTRGTIKIYFCGRIYIYIYKIILLWKLMLQWRAVNTFCWALHFSVLSVQLDKFCVGTVDSPESLVATYMTSQCYVIVLQRHKYICNKHVWNKDLPPGKHTWIYVVNNLISVFCLFFFLSFHLCYLLIVRVEVILALDHT